MKYALSVLLAFILSAVSLRSQSLSISTLALDCVSPGTLGADVSYGISRHWSVMAGGKYNPYSHGEGADARQNRQRTVSAGARYWPWHVYSGWWMGCRAGWQEYNKGGYGSRETSEGERYGAGFSGGYSYMLSQHLNLDFGVGFWGGVDNFVTYSCPSCGRIVDGGQKYFVMPNDFILALTFIF